MTKFLCGVSFQQELGHRKDIHFYDSLDELKAKSKCVHECGAVMIDYDKYPEKYTSFKWVIEQDLFGDRFKRDPKAKTKSDPQNQN